MIRAPHVTPGLHRVNSRQDWSDVEIIGPGPNGQFICREAGRPLPGVFLAFRSDLREAGGILKMECLRAYGAPGRTLAGRSAG